VLFVVLLIQRKIRGNCARFPDWQCSYPCSQRSAAAVVMALTAWEIPLTMRPRRVQGITTAAPADRCEHGYEHSSAETRTRFPADLRWISKTTNNTKVPRLRRAARLRVITIGDQDANKPVEQTGGDVRQCAPEGVCQTARDRIGNSHRVPTRTPVKSLNIEHPGRKTQIGTAPIAVRFAQQLPPHLAGTAPATC